MTKYLIIICLLLIGVVSILSVRLSNIKEELSISISNNKAYMLENESLENDIRVFQLTVDQLNYFADSIMQEMLNVKEELKIKDKDLARLQYIKSEAIKTDSIVIRDTIFKTDVNIDTLFQDNWYSLKLKLRYPNIAIVTPSFVSDKYIVASLHKETINPPKKCKIARWFQRKHKVLKVNIIEKSPYIKNKQVKFIEIIK